MQRSPLYVFGCSSISRRRHLTSPASFQRTVTHCPALRSLTLTPCSLMRWSIFAIIKFLFVRKLIENCGVHETRGPAIYYITFAARSQCHCCVKTTVFLWP